MAASAAPVVLSTEQAGWMQSGVCSVVVASSSARNRPSLGLSLGCRLDEGRGRVVVFLAEAPNHDLLCDLRAGRRVSVLFTQSSTTRALQLKAPAAREVPLAPGDWALLDGYAAALAAEWGKFGQPESFTRTLLGGEGTALVAFEVIPEETFDQTPGPRAGSPLKAGT